MEHPSDTQMHDLGRKRANERKRERVGNEVATEPMANLNIETKRQRGAPIRPTGCDPKANPPKPAAVGKSNNKPGGKQASQRSTIRPDATTSTVHFEQQEERGASAAKRQKSIVHSRKIRGETDGFPTLTRIKALPVNQLHMTRRGNPSHSIVVIAVEYKLVTVNLRNPKTNKPFQIHNTRPYRVRGNGTDIFYIWDNCTKNEQGIRKNEDQQATSTEYHNAYNTIRPGDTLQLSPITTKKRAPEGQRTVQPWAVTAILRKATAADGVLAVGVPYTVLPGRAGGCDVVCDRYGAVFEVRYQNGAIHAPGTNCYFENEKDGTTSFYIGEGSFGKASEDTNTQCSDAGSEYDDEGL